MRQTRRYKEKKYRIGRDALTPGQVSLLMDSFNKIDEKALIQLAIATGMRRLDVVSVKRADLNLDTGILKFYEHKKDRNWDLVIPSQACLATLRQHLNSARDSIWLFPSPKLGKFRKGHISDRQAYDVFNEALKRCGLPQRPFHSCRATCVKQCLAAGWSWESISELTGDQVSTLQYHYAVPSVGEMAKLAREKPIM